MKKIFAFLFVVCLLGTEVVFAGGNGLVRVQSTSDVQTTAQRLLKALEDNGMHLFTRVDHQAGAAKVGLELRPTELFIFGNPKAGTPLMQCSQSVGIDLPQKMLITQDEKGVTWVTYNDPQYLAERHELNGCGDKVLVKIGKTLEKLSLAAAGK